MPSCSRTKVSTTASSLRLPHRLARSPPMLMPSKLLPFLLVMSACATTAAPSQPAPAPEVATLPSAPAPREVTWAGVILSRESRLVTAEVEGRVDQILVEQGRRVRAGET